eukprot:1551047-Alexandrium_andersonii.AAC.1
MGARRCHCRARGDAPEVQSASRSRPIGAATSLDPRASPPNIHNRVMHAELELRSPQSGPN